MRTSRSRRLALCLLPALLAPAAGRAQVAAQPVATRPAAAQPPAAPVQEVWETAYLDGYRVGYVHLTVANVTDKNGLKFVRAHRELSLTVRRGADVARVQALTGTDETADGTVLAVFMRQLLGTKVEQTLAGSVQGRQLHVKAQGGQANFEKDIPWDPRVVGTLGELNLLRNRQPPPNPGDKFDYLLYEPIINTLVTVRVTVEGYEAVAIRGERPKLLRVSAVPDEIKGVQLPSQILWFDANYDIRRSMTVMPGMGYLVVERSDRAHATEPLDPKQLPDLMQRQSIALKQRLTHPHQSGSIVYRITLTGDKEPAKTFAQDNRQTVRNVQGNTFELAVQAVREPPAQGPPGAADPGPEFTESNYFITSDDPLVKQYAATAVGRETDPWRKAKLIEAWVHRSMRVLNFSEAMAPAFEVAKTLAGDCTEFAMLTAAMCRAAGVPSRTAIGLVYVDAPAPRPPVLGFHMWTEVHVRGTWVAIDATLGQGGVGPAHLKITDASWHNMRSMEPLLPLMRVMLAKPAVDVAEVK
jgi:hypothetical protein